MKAALSAFAGSMLIVGSVDAATITLPTVTIPLEFTAPSSTVNHDFTVPGFNSALGTLTGVRVDIFDVGDSSTLTWTLQNNGSTTVSGFNAYEESYQIRLLRADTLASLSSNTSSSSATFGFSLAPGAQTTVTAFGPGGGSGGSLSSGNRSYFNTPSNVSLRLQSIGANLTTNPNLSVVGQSGTVEATATVDIRYTYTSNNTTPPPATPIVISSSTNASLAAAGEVDWYSFEYGSGALTIDTIGSALSPDNDTFIALFNSTGTRVGQNDDASGLGTLSRLNFAAGALTAGTYYLAVAGFGTSTSFQQGFDVTSNSVETGSYVVNLNGTPVPAGSPRWPDWHSASDGAVGADSPPDSRRLTAMPDPMTGAALLAGLAAYLSTRRRRRTCAG